MSQKDKELFFALFFAFQSMTFIVSMLPTLLALVLLSSLAMWSMIVSLLPSVTLVLSLQTPKRHYIIVKHLLFHLLIDLFLVSFKLALQLPLSLSDYLQCDCFDLSLRLDPSPSLQVCLFN